MTEATASSVLDYEAFVRTPVELAPYPWLFVPRFIRPEAFAAIERDFPEIAGSGSYPPDELQSGPRFDDMLHELEGPAFRRLAGEKFGLDLAGRATMVTVRGRLALKNGEIHTDTESKLITVLIYFNRRWDERGGRLRVLRSGADLNDYAAEIPPVEGNLLAFRVGRNSWHGHLPAESPRKAIQLNWVTDEAVVRREIRRHRVSAKIKALSGLLRSAR
jgi:SM-20-related protein